MGEAFLLCMTFATFSYTRVLVTFTDGEKVVQETLVSKDIGSLLSGEMEVVYGGTY